MMAAEAGASKLTLAAYRNDFDRSAQVLGSIGSASLEDISRLGSSWSDLAPSTVARRSAALRRFFGFLVDEGLRRDDPSSALPRPRFERPLPRILDEEEVRRMFEAAEERAASGEALARRNLALLELLYGSGLRASELVGLPRGAVRPGQPFRWFEARVRRSGSCRFPRGRKVRSRNGLKVWIPRRPGCFPAAGLISAECASSRSFDRWLPTPAFCPSVSVHTCFATLSPPTSSRGEPTFECSSRSLGMPISRPRRSTPMSTAPGWSSWSTPATRSPTRAR